MKRHGLLLLLIFALCGCQLLPGQSTKAPVVSTSVTPLPATLTPAPLPTATLPVPTAALTLTAVPAASPVPAGPLLLVSQAIADSNTNPAYTFKVHYPQLQSASAPGLVAFNQTSEKLATDLLASYQANLKSNFSTPDPSFSSSFMETNYQVIHGSDGLLSILFGVSDYWAGAAHPNSYSMVLNFNLITGKKLELKDLFKPGINYLQVIADYSAADLKKRDRLEFPEGVLPKPENFQNWAISDQGLVFYFDPYQVAAYALGPSQVLMPYAALKSVLDPAGPLGAAVK